MLVASGSGFLPSIIPGYRNIGILRYKTAKLRKHLQPSVYGRSLNLTHCRGASECWSSSPCNWSRSIEFRWQRKFTNYLIKIKSNKETYLDWFKYRLIIFRSTDYFANSAKIWQLNFRWIAHLFTSFDIKCFKFKSL